MIARDPWFPPVDPELSELFASHDLTLVGVADAENATAPAAELRQWLSQNMHGTMTWMERHEPMKYDPQQILPRCQSILFAALNYYQKLPPKTTARTISPDDTAPTGRVARYAWGRDYHKELGNRLRRIARVLRERYPEEAFQPGVDATPLSERYYGELAGVGFTGRHTLLINGQYGSWFLLGEILSTRKWTATPPAEPLHGACPRGCRKCIDVCPTGALLGPHKIDARRCISYLTIEHDGAIPEELRPAMGEWLFGCDLCQEVCPLNIRAQVTAVTAFTTPIAGDRVLLREILSMRERDEFVQRFAGSPLMRPGLTGLQRNACVVAGNLGDPSLLPLLNDVLQDERVPELVKEHAQWAVSCISSAV